ncbi:unnamed protein product [Calypogeia fissa]
MAKPRQGPSLKKFMVLTAVLVTVVLVYRMMSSIPLDLLSKQSYNRVYYEQMYSEVSDEVADWRQRYDSEFGRAEEYLKSLSKMQSQVKLLQEENESLKADLIRLKDQVKEHDASTTLVETLVEN